MTIWQYDNLKKWQWRYNNMTICHRVKERESGQESGKSTSVLERFIQQTLIWHHIYIWSEQYLIAMSDLNNIWICMYLVSDLNEEGKEICEKSKKREEAESDTLKFNSVCSLLFWFPQNFTQCFYHLDVIGAVVDVPCVLNELKAGFFLGEVVGL